MEPETSGTVEAWTSDALTYLALTLGLAVMFKYLFTSSVPGNIPPFPARAYPLLGHLPYLAKDLKRQMTEWTEATGDIFSLYFGHKLVVILSGYEVTHQAYIKNAHTVSDRPPDFYVQAVGDESDLGIGGASGKVWKEQRAVSVQILKSFGMGKNILGLKVSEEISVYLEALSRLGGQATDVRTLNKNAVSNIICSIIVGKRFDYNDDYFASYIAKQEELLRLSMSVSLFTVFPWVRHIPGDLFGAKLRIRMFRELVDFFCDRYISKTKIEDDEVNKDNFISAYLNEKKRLEKDGQETSLDDKNLTRVIYDLFVAGTDTTSTAINWFMIYMLHYPDIQEKVFTEISGVLGLQREPSMHDKTKLNFLTATIMEVQRMTISPLNLPHYTTKDTVIKGYTIPAGTTVIPCLETFHSSPKHWEEPTKFKPERFIDDHGNIKTPDQFSPFGLGRRACPGEALAKMELFLFLSSLLQRFELRPEVPGQLPSLEPVPGIIYSPQPFKLRFVDRRGL